MDYNDYGFFKIIAHDNHKVVMDMLAGSIDNGTELTVFSDYNFPNQSWTLVPDKEKGYFRIISRKSGKCLEINSKGI